MSDERCGLNGCENPVRREVEVGEYRSVTLALCAECAADLMSRSARYP